MWSPCPKMRPCISYQCLKKALTKPGLCHLLLQREQVVWLPLATHSHILDHALPMYDLHQLSPASFPFPNLSIFACVLQLYIRKFHIRWRVLSFFLCSHLAHLMPSPGWLTCASLAFNGRPSKYHLLQHTMYSTTTCKPQRSHKNLFFANMNIMNVLTDLHWFRENSSDLGLTSIQAPHAFQLSVEEPHRRRPSSNRSGCFKQPILSKKREAHSKCHNRPFILGCGGYCLYE